MPAAYAGGTYGRAETCSIVSQRPKPGGPHSRRVRIARQRSDHAPRRRSPGHRTGAQARACRLAQNDEAGGRAISSNRRHCAAARGRAVTRYMLDTNIISDLIRNPQGSAAKRIAKVGENNICTSIIVAAELRYGCARSGSKRLRDAVEELLSEMTVLPFDVPADSDYGAIRSELEAAGRSIGPNDLLIAAHACAAGATIVTANADEFKRI